MSAVASATSMILLQKAISLEDKMGLPLSPWFLRKRSLRPMLMRSRNFSWRPPTRLAKYAMSAGLFLRQSVSSCEIYSASMLSPFSSFSLVLTIELFRAFLKTYLSSWHTVTIDTEDV